MDKETKRVLDASKALINSNTRKSNPDWWMLYGDLEEAVRERNIAEARKAGM